MLEVYIMFIDLGIQYSYRVYSFEDAMGIFKTYISELEGNYSTAPESFVFYDNANDCWKESTERKFCDYLLDGISIIQVLMNSVERPDSVLGISKVERETVPGSEKWIESTTESTN